MLDHRAVRVELDPTSTQRSALFSCAALSRKVFNWGLERQKAHYEQVVKPARARGEKVYTLSVKELSQEWTKVKADVLPWCDQVPRMVATQALRDLDQAFTNFFVGRKAGRRVGYPRFKSRDRSRVSFRCQTARSLGAGHVFLPGIRSIRVKHDPAPRLVGRTIGMATVSEQAGHWFASFATSEEIADPITKIGSVIGIDLGITTFAVCSDGRRIESPRPLETAITRLKALDRGIARQRNVRDGVRSSRMARRDLQSAKAAGTYVWPTSTERKAAKLAVKASTRAATHAIADHDKTKQRHERKSARMVKRQAERARLHYTVTNQRRNFLHEASTRLVQRHAVIKIEDLAVGNLKRNHRLARSISDQGWAMFRFMLTYKARLAGTQLIVIDRFYPSTQVCSRCGSRTETPLGQSIYRCSNPACGLVIDRDLNAARNIAKQPAMAAGRGGAISRGRKSAHVPSSRRPTTQINAV
jgi:putative transposase